MPPKKDNDRQDKQELLVWLGSLLRFFDRITYKTGLVAAFIILVIMTLLTYEVIARYLFNNPTIWAMETSQLLMCVAVALGGGFSYKYGAHVNVDILVSRFSTRKRSIIKLFSETFVFLFLGAFLYKMGSVTLESVKVRETSGTFFDAPVYPIKIIIMISLFLMFLQVIVRFFNTFSKAIKK